MLKYCVNNNAQYNGDHEVHIYSCQYLPESRTYLGEHASCRSAVTASKAYFRQTNGCYYCCNACHTQ